MAPNDAATVTANLLASWALVVAIFAAVVSLVAAGFAGWQAVTVHFERTRPRPAALVIPSPDPGGSSVIENEGSSAAHNVSLYAFGRPSTRRGRREAVRSLNKARAPRLLGEPITTGGSYGSIRAGGAVKVQGLRTRRGRTGLDILYAPVLVYWTDGRGKRHHAWIDLR